MRDDQLLQDIENSLKPAWENEEWLAALGINTYSQLFAFIKDKATDPALRARGCYLLSFLRDAVDARRATPPLLEALKTSDDNIRQCAAQALGMLKSRRAVPPLIDILKDKTQPIRVRHAAIDGLALIADQRALPLFRQIIDDAIEPIELRTYAIELLYEEPEPIERFIELLADPVPDIRFWAAFRLSSMSPVRALEALDRVVAFDHTLPVGWGWHIDREAMLPLETIYYRKIRGTSDDIEDSQDWYGHGPMYLISPAPEYDTLIWLYRRQDEGYCYTTDPLPDIQLHIDPHWLEEQLKAAWPTIQINVRQPRPQAYLLDWRLEIGETLLIGALHRDAYAVTVTATKKGAVMEFAAWYLQFFPAEQRLYLYEWADRHVEIKPGMTPDNLLQASEARYAMSIQEQMTGLAFG